MEKVGRTTMTWILVGLQWSWWWLQWCYAGGYTDYDDNVSRWTAEKLESGDEAQDPETESHLWTDSLRSWEEEGNYPRSSSTSSSSSSPSSSSSAWEETLIWFRQERGNWAKVGTRVGGTGDWIIVKMKFWFQKSIKVQCHLLALILKFDQGAFRGFNKISVSCPWRKRQ